MRCNFDCFNCIYNDCINNGNSYSQEYYDKNRNKILAYHREYYQKNKDKILDCYKEYRQKNRDKILAYHKEYYAKKREIRKGGLSIERGKNRN